MPSSSCNFGGGATLLAAPEASPYRTAPLSATGTLYFSCSTPGHCDDGQLVQVQVSAAGAAPPAQCSRFLNTFASC